MRIGVVCEGPTDFLTIRSFLEAEFSKVSISVSFGIIQPALDNTLPGGWSQVLYWLENNPYLQRSALYLTGDALFLAEDHATKFDALLFQIDTDIIGESGFETFISDRGVRICRPVHSVARGDYIREILRKIAGHSNEEAEMLAKELSLAIVESCETWIIAAALAEVDDPENISGQDLIDFFGKVMAEFSGSPIQGTYASINKKVRTRDKLCKSTAEKSSPLGRAPHYDKIFEQIRHLCPLSA